jgi:hypothetical protein
LNLAARLIAGLDAEPLERAGRWDDDPAPPALLHHQPGKMEIHAQPNVSASCSV